MRLDRVDYVGVIELRTDKDAPLSLPTPGHAPASLTPEGYLDVDALLARDGLLEYSDGSTTWIEYRPRAELEKAAATWAGDPVTDQHPSKMVDATTWCTVARGIALGCPTVEVHDGIAFLRCRLRITDQALIKKVERGDQVQLSIGFTSAVKRTENGQAPGGIPCDAIQLDLDGNHIAVVDRGRAGPACRLLLDSAAWTDYQGPSKMTIKNTPPRKDEVGPAATEVEYPAPDGTTAMLPTWVVAQLQEYQQLKAAAPAAPAGDAPAAAVAPPNPAAAPVAPAAAAPGVPLQPARDGKGEDVETEEKANDAMRSIRRKLDRLAASAGVPDDVLDSSDSRVVARAFLAKAAPHVKCDKMDARALITAFEIVTSAPRADAEHGRPWGGHVGDPKTEKADAAPDPEVEFLKRQGFG